MIRFWRVLPQGMDDRPRYQHHFSCQPGLNLDVSLLRHFCFTHSPLFLLKAYEIAGYVRKNAVNNRLSILFNGVCYFASNL